MSPGHLVLGRFSKKFLDVSVMMVLNDPLKVVTLGGSEGMTFDVSAIRETICSRATSA